MQGQAERKKAPGFKRYCEYEPCGKYFETNREWQRFHHKDCRLASYKEKKGIEKRIMKRLDDHERRISSLEGKAKNEK